MSSAVDNTTTDNLASTTPATEAPNGTAPAASSTDAAAASADEGRRLYIGNLAYATTEGELKEFFTNYKM
ncbi:RNP domain protein [Aspergillus rambellii]|uniref:RNP domain protein n=1 Tax=Aspergillus rambellii TaxID=308745 RepID=A0A0F8WHE2_9EURO|nr:RNP domain protein [Aspergillus rambellii]